MNQYFMRRISCVVALCVLSPIALYAEPVLFLADGNSSSLWTINTTTGNATRVGSLGLTPSLIGLAYDSVGGDLLMTSSNGDNSQLFRLDQSTGQASLVGDTGSQAISGLAFDPHSQVLYGGSGATNSLFTIDRGTGAATLVGGYGVEVGGHGLGFDSQNQQLLMTDVVQDTLYSVDRNTGAATAIGGTGLTSVAGLAFHSGENRLYGINANDDTLVRLNTSTGVGEVVGDLGFDAFNVGLAFRPSAIPEPSSGILLLAVGCVAVVRSRRRRAGCRF
ncbi:hypothetical protein Enr13x_38260 [Stieleria neptunia]|uniref:DUF6923 domain-containing protein n=1 Tax=Stieleria neptunia TaxID=2527979 RepID=A0A518HSY8_9BACT|nr:PEP-CTERM sorting domain-containing protein [Stieleria neptunia]QDV43965.1 hypothetical protein Enr13x_38260 [Stieleria neptunia]